MAISIALDVGKESREIFLGHSHEGHTTITKIGKSMKFAELN